MSSTLWLIALAALLIVTRPATADELDKRRELEASALFQIILSEQDEDPEACGYSNEWDDYAIPYEIVQRHFGLALVADVSAPTPSLKPAGILDPKARMSGVFCDEEQADARRKVLLKLLESGVSSTKRANGSPAPLMFVRTHFGFPVFNTSFTRAAVFVGKSELGWMRGRNGKVLQFLPEAAGWIEIYHKRNGKWRRHAIESLYIT